MSKKHSQIGASSCHRWWNCPGSVALCEGLPPQEPSSYAKEGTAAHELAERSIFMYPKNFIGQQAKNGVVFTSEMAKHVQFYREIVFGDMDDAGVDHDEIQVETKFHLTDIDEDAFGTCDAYWAEPFGTLHVYDFKYGAGVPVEAKNNLQMQYYALGALQTGDYDAVEMVIVQPRTDEPVKRWTVTLEEMDEFKAQLKAHIEAAKADNAPLNDGKWCKWCPALAQCPQVSKKVVEVAQQDFQPTTTALPEPGALTPVQLKLVLDKAELLTDWITAVESYAKSIMEAGTRIEGWKLVPKRAHRKWKDEFEVETALADLGDRIYDKKLKTPKQMEAVAGKEKVAELSETPDNGLTIAPDEDSREEAKSDFTAITDETKTEPVKQERKRGRPTGSRNKKSENADL